MIKSEKGRIELVGKVNQILAELAAIVQGVNYTLCEKKGNTPEAVHAAIMEAVKLGLDADAADVEEVEALISVLYSVHNSNEANNVVLADKIGEQCRKSMNEQGHIWSF